MTIIAQQSMNQKQLTAKFFSNLMRKSLNRTHLDSIVTGLYDSTHNDHVFSKFKSLAEMLKQYGIDSNDANYKAAWAAMKKLGLILKHNNRYAVNPAVESSAVDGRPYELIIEYYNILFKESNFTLYTLEDIKTEVINASICKTKAENIDIERNNETRRLYPNSSLTEQTLKKEYTYDELYSIAFDPSSKGVNPSRKRALNDAYRISCNKYVEELILHHIDLLEEQGLIEVTVQGRSTVYIFNDFTVKMQKSLKHYTKLPYYTNYVPSTDEYVADHFNEEPDLTIPPTSEDINEPTLPEPEQDYTLTTPKLYKKTPNASTQALVNQDKISRLVLDKGVSYHEAVRIVEQQSSTLPSSTITLDRTQLPEDHPDYCPF